MKKLIVTLLLIAGMTSAIDAQWVSPGLGESYTLMDIVEISNGAMVFEGGNFFIMQDITISDDDILAIAELGDTHIALKLSTLTIKGLLSIESPTWILGDDVSGICFDHARRSEIGMTSFEYLAGINLIESDIMFMGCTFTGFSTEYTSAAVTYMNCNPNFTMCVFTNNEGPAIASGANVQGSPSIVLCQFRGNNTANTNSPQINLGPGGEDEIVIEGCDIIGDGHNMVGGISISNILAIGTTRVRLTNNYVANNRYGYNQQGDNIIAELTSNEFLSNDLETNPMNGGSGVSIYGASTNCKATLRNNFIAGNLWGVTAINMHNIDMGTEENWGHNRIFKNVNTTGEFDLYNNSACDISAVGNFWGTTNEELVEEYIFHKTDDPSLGLVTYLPLWDEDGIPEVNVVPTLDNRVYSVDGRCLGTEVPEDYKGFYIQNGKKYFR